MKCCFNCEDRQVGCHSECERYLKAKAERDEEREKRRSEKNAYYDMECYVVNKSYKRMKNRRK